jgi:hypothetical protein
LSKSLFIWLATVWTEIGIKELPRNYYSAAISNQRHRPKRSASATGTPMPFDAYATELRGL